MLLFKGLLMGSAAATVLATGSTFAADLPSRKAAPVAYVKICDVYGRGFYYIPGTNTCLKVGGRVRFEVFYHKAQNAWVQATSGLGGGTFFSGARQDNLGWRARAYVNMDARTQTAWGTVQAVTSLQVRSRSGLSNAGGSFNPGGANGANVSLDAAYIRFAGFTMGRAPYLFASGPGFLFYRTSHTSGSPIGSMQLAYTAVFGGGFSATIGIEDSNNQGRQRGFYAVDSVSNLFAAPAAGVFPNRLPNLVVGLRVDQGWGFAQVTGAIGRTGAVFGTTPATTFKVNTTGWGVGGVVKINLPSLARGDALWLSAQYCIGLDICANGDSTNGSIAKDGRRMGGYVPTYQTASYFLNNAGFPAAERTKFFMASATFTHYWTPSLRSNLGVSYLRITPGTVSRNADWGSAPIAANGFSAGGQPVSSHFVAQGNLIWSPTRGFDIGLELYYAKATNKLACPPAPFVCSIWGTGNSAGVKRNPDDFAVTFRAQRTF